mgnify:FL=1
MKTKEEVIKEAWGKNYEEFKDHIDSDGWARYPHFQKHEMIEDVRPIEFRSQGADFRPKSLQGIENNNGWIKIESEDDFPKPGQYWVIDQDGDMFLTDMELFADVFDWSGINYYQPIIKPNVPWYQ